MLKIKLSDKTLQIFKSLTPREEALLKKRFSEKDPNDVYEDFKVSKERIRQIEEKALRRFRGHDDDDPPPRAA